MGVPDFFQLDGKTVALISPQEMQAQGLEFHNGNANVCLIGSYDPQTHAFTRESATAIDYGMDFYATQSLVSPDGRRILIAWMQNWENYMTPCGYKWSGMMTFPRELHVKDGRLCQTPVEEIARYYTGTVQAQGSAGEGFQELEGVSGRVFDMTVTLDPAACRNLEIRLGVEGRFYTSLQYLGQQGLFVTKADLLWQPQGPVGPAGDGDAGGPGPSGAAGADGQIQRGSVCKRRPACHDLPGVRPPLGRGHPVCGQRPLPGGIPPHPDGHP